MSWPRGIESILGGVNAGQSPADGAGNKKRYSPAFDINSGVSSSAVILRGSTRTFP